MTRHRRVDRLFRLSLILLATIALACGAEPASTPISIELAHPTVASDACMDALGQGTLVTDARSGLGLRANTGEVTSVVWPIGYTAVWNEGVIVLVDPQGTVIAQVGDLVQMGGGFGNNGFFFSCPGSIKRV